MTQPPTIQVRKPFERLISYMAATSIPELIQRVQKGLMPAEAAMTSAMVNGLLFGYELSKVKPEYATAMIEQAKKELALVGFNQQDLTLLVTATIRDIPMATEKPPPEGGPIPISRAERRRLRKP